MCLNEKKAEITVSLCNVSVRVSNVSYDRGKRSHVGRRGTRKGGRNRLSLLYVRGNASPPPSLPPLQLT